MTVPDKLISIINILILTIIIFTLSALPTIFAFVTSPILIVFLLLITLLIIIGTYNIYKYLVIRKTALNEMSLGTKFLLSVPALNFAIFVLGIILINIL